MNSPAEPVCPQVFLDIISDEVSGAFGIVCGHIRSSFSLLVSIDVISMAFSS